MKGFRDSGLSGPAVDGSSSATSGEDRELLYGAGIVLNFRNGLLDESVVESGRSCRSVRGICVISKHAR